MSLTATKGAGSVRKKKVHRAGKVYTYWEARITEGRCPITGKQKQRSFSGGTKEEVLQKMIAYESSRRIPAAKGTKVGSDIFSPGHITQFFPNEGEKQPGAYVYFISDGLAVKIGASTNIAGRVAEMQVGNPRTLEVLFTVPFSDMVVATAAERKYHAIFRNYWLRGEWFVILPRLDVEAWRAHWARETMRKDENDELEF